MVNLHTSRLILRRITPSDAEQLLLLRSDPLVNQYLDRQVATSIEEVSAFIQKIEAAFYWGICLKSDDLVIGTISLFHFSGGKAEIGYELLPVHQKKGIMHEAIQAIIDYAFHKLKLTFLYAKLKPENKPSVDLLERNKFKLNGYHLLQEENMVVYSLTNQQEYRKG